MSEKAASASVPAVPKTSQMARIVVHRDALPSPSTDHGVNRSRFSLPVREDPLPYRRRLSCLWRQRCELQRVQRRAWRAPCSPGSDHRVAVAGPGFMEALVRSPHLLVASPSPRAAAGPLDHSSPVKISIPVHDRTIRQRSSSYGVADLSRFHRPSPGVSRFSAPAMAPKRPAPVRALKTSGAPPSPWSSRRSPVPVSLNFAVSPPQLFQRADSAVFCPFTARAVPMRGVRLRPVHAAWPNRVAREFARPGRNPARR
jgi:hypothetical protein